MSGRDDLIEHLPLAELLARLADRTPAPGGGSAAAWSLAIAAALVEMGCAFTLSREEFTGVSERIDAIRLRSRHLGAASLDLAREDLESFQAVLEAMRRPREDPDRSAALLLARSAAAQVPLRTATAAAEVAELAAEVAASGNPNLIGDAVTGALLAEAACRAAVNLVEINLGDAPGDPRLAEAAGLAASAFQARSRALG